MPQHTELINALASHEAPVMLLNSKGTIVYKNMPAERLIRMNRREKVLDYLVPKSYAAYERLFVQRSVTELLEFQIPGAYRCASACVTQSEGVMVIVLQFLSSLQFVKEDAETIARHVEEDILSSIAVVNTAGTLIAQKLGDTETELVETYTRQQKNIYALFRVLRQYHTVCLGEHLTKSAVFADCRELVSEIVNLMNQEKPSTLPAIVMLPPEHGAEEYCCKIYAEELQKYLCTWLCDVLSGAVRDVFLRLHQNEAKIKLSVEYVPFVEETTESGEASAEGRAAEHYLTLRRYVSDLLAKLNGWSFSTKHEHDGTMRMSLTLPKNCIGSSLHAKRIAATDEQRELRKMLIGDELKHLFYYTMQKKS